MSCTSVVIFCDLQPCEQAGIGAMDSWIGFLSLAFINEAF